MRVAVEMPFDVEGKRGWIYYTESLLRELAKLDQDNEYWIFNFFFRNYSEKLRTIYCPKAQNFSLHVQRWPESLIRRAEWSLKLPVIETYLKARKVDVYHATRAPITSCVPTVVTIHDIMYVKHPGYMYPKFRWGWENGGVPSLKTVSRFIAHSEHHKRELVTYLGVDESRIRVIPTGTNTDIFHPVEDRQSLTETARTMNLPRRFVLMIGPFSRWWCHYDAVFHALARLSAGHPDLHLVMVGDDASEGAKRLQGLARSLNLQERVVWLGRVSGSQLLMIFNLAVCNVYPAWDTGCSINVLDSMAAGLPVVTSRVSLLPEMLGEAGVWADPFSPTEMETAIRRLAEDAEFRRQCAEACLRRARTRTWESTARATLAVYREAAG